MINHQPSLITANLTTLDINTLSSRLHNGTAIGTVLSAEEQWRAGGWALSLMDGESMRKFMVNDASWWLNDG